ncbi:MarR family winged helix-turn-helix transcriptional regulator [Kitasatospora purpeofusca]|uniref:MarR family winged helix-turn-helix transcriptional regulator n=1 Tax=Kitasatospora purpeofusca TaxID=67352 RepID=UPI002A5A7AFA|nr:MarR family transcriptional regulator [Kitasatospora purpeofusca]MDY0815873.1 MarR family transcriptional regulator [Kitasatospora purpeofusca]
MTDHTAPARVRGLPSRLLAVNALHADRLVNDGLAAEGARKWHFAALTALTDGGPASQSDLSRRTGIYRSDMVAVVNELAGRGLVERTSDPADRRRNVITVTAEGRAHLRRLDTVVDAAQDALLAPLDADDRARLTDLLTRLLDHHEHTSVTATGDEPAPDVADG